MIPQKTFFNFQAINFYSVKHIIFAVLSKSYCTKEQKQSLSLTAEFAVFGTGAKKALSLSEPFLPVFIREQTLRSFPDFLIIQFVDITSLRLVSYIHEKRQRNSIEINDALTDHRKSTKRNSIMEHSNRISMEKPSKKKEYLKVQHCKISVRVQS